MLIESMELKNTVTELKKLLARLQQQTKAEERISEFEYISLEIMQSEEQK